MDSVNVLIIKAMGGDDTSDKISVALAQNISAAYGGAIYEAFLPKNSPNFCTGCRSCIDVKEEHCPHFAIFSGLLDAILSADVVIFSASIYRAEIPASLVNLFDHMNYLSAAHRPSNDMWKKSFVYIITSEKFGTRHVSRALKRNLYMFLPRNVHGIRFSGNFVPWEELTRSSRYSIQKRINKITESVLKSSKKKAPSVITRLIFMIAGFYHSNINRNAVDIEYWGNNGWFDKIRPWKRKLDDLF